MNRQTTPIVPRSERAIPAALLLRVRNALGGAIAHVTKAEFLNGVQWSFDGLMRLDAEMEALEQKVYALYDGILEAREVLRERLEKESE